MTGSSGRDRPDRKRQQLPRKRLALLQDQFREDLQHWVMTNPRVAIRLLTIMDGCLPTPFEGIGKPEPLKRLSAWSRLTDTDRVVYVVRETEIDFLQARFHYGD